MNKFTLNTIVKNVVEYLEINQKRGIVYEI